AFFSNDRDKIVECPVAVEHGKGIYVGSHPVADVADEPRAGHQINDCEEGKHDRNKKERERRRQPKGRALQQVTHCHAPSFTVYPLPRIVWIRSLPYGLSILARSREICVSTTLVLGSK